MLKVGSNAAWSNTMKVADLSKADLEVFYRRALNEAADERPGDTAADVVRRHFGDVVPDDEGQGSARRFEPRRGAEETGRQQTSAGKAS